MGSNNISMIYYIIKSSFFTCVWMCITQLVHADKVVSVDDLDARINYAAAVSFEVSYNKSLYELELKYHGDDDPSSVVISEIKKKLTVWEKNYRAMLGKIAQEKIVLNEKEKMSALKFKCETLSGSRIIGLFTYVRITSPEYYRVMIAYYLNLCNKYKVSDLAWEKKLWISWTSNTIFIPISVQGADINWSQMTPYEYAKSQLKKAINKREELEHIQP